jgi:hypothetical protein
VWHTDVLDLQFAMTDSATDQCDANIVIVDADEGDTFYCHSISETFQNFYKNAQNGSEVCCLDLNCDWGLSGIWKESTQDEGFQILKH